MAEEAGEAVSEAREEAKRGETAGRGERVRGCSSLLFSSTFTAV